MDDNKSLDALENGEADNNKQDIDSLAKTKNPESRVTFQSKETLLEEEEAEQEVDSLAKTKNPESRVAFQSKESLLEDEDEEDEESWPEQLEPDILEGVFGSIGNSTLFKRLGQLAIVITLIIVALGWIFNAFQLPLFYFDLPATNVTYDEAKCTFGSEDNLYWCRGMEAPTILKYTGWRGFKLSASPELFIGPHCALGLLLLGMFGLFLLGKLLPKGYLPTTQTLTPIYFAVMIGFSIHIFPVKHLLPNRVWKVSFNEAILAVSFADAFLGLGCMLYLIKNDSNSRGGLWAKRGLLLAWIISVVPVVGPVLLQAQTVNRETIAYQETGVRWFESDTPSPLSGVGPYADVTAGEWVGPLATVIICLVMIGFWFRKAVKRFYPNFRFSKYLEKGKDALSRSNKFIKGKKYKAKRHYKYKYTCGFRKMGILFASLFLLTVVIGFILTVTFTRFDAETDLIINFFAISNPCIVFDHYPAKLSAMMFVSIWCVVGVCWAGLLWLWVYGKRNLQALMFGTLVIMVHIWYFVQFINVFAFDLYDDDVPIEEYGAVNSTVSAAQIETLSQHTKPYLNLEFSDTMMMIYQIGLISIYAKERTWVKRCRTGALVFLAACLFAAYVELQGILYWGQHDISSAAEGSFVMGLAVMAKAIQAQIWSGVAQLSYRIMLPSSWKVRATFSSKPHGHGWNKLSPEQLLTLCFRFLLAVICLVFMFADPQEPAEIAGGGSEFSNPAFQSGPGVLIFAPVTACLAVFFGVGVWLTFVRIRIWGNADNWPKWRRHLSTILAVLFVLNIVISSWRILPEVSWTNSLDYPLFFLFSAWCFVSTPDNPMSHVYNITVTIFLCLGYLHWAFQVAALMLLCFYERGLGRVPPLYIRIDPIGGFGSEIVEGKEGDDDEENDGLLGGDGAEDQFRPEGVDMTSFKSFRDLKSSMGKSFRNLRQGNTFKSFRRRRGSGVEMAEPEG